MKGHGMEGCTGSKMQDFSKKKDNKGDETGKRGELIARNYAYKPVIINEKQSIKRYKLGDKVNVRIFDATSLDLRGEIVK